MTNVLKIALKKLKETQNSYYKYTACLTYAEVQELLKDGYELSRSENDNDIFNYMKQQMKKGMNMANWFYFKKSGKHLPIEGKRYARKSMAA